VGDLQHLKVLTFSKTKRQLKCHTSKHSGRVSPGFHPGVRGSIPCESIWYLWYKKCQCTYPSTSPFPCLKLRQCSILVFIYILLFSGGQTVGGWERSEKCPLGIGWALQVTVGPYLNFKNPNMPLELETKLNWSTKFIIANSSWAEWVLTTGRRGSALTVLLAIKWR